MKTTIQFLVFLFFSFELNAQDYTCIKTSKISYFADDSTMHAIKLDSSVTRNDGVHLYNYPTIRYNYDKNCIINKQNSWIGQEVVVSSNGYNYFINSMGDTLAINTLSKLNDTSFFYEAKKATNTLAASSKILAITEKADTATILGVLDSIKTIRFASVDESGNSIEHWANNRKIILSKNHGLFKMFAFYDFPDSSTNDFTLFSNGANTHISNMDIYNFDIGDEFHTLFIKTKLDYISYDSIEKTIKKVIDKNISNNQDTIIYTYSICSRHEHLIKYQSNDTHNFNSFSSFYDTIQEKVIMSKLENEIIPDQIIGSKYVVVNKDINGFSLIRQFGTFYSHMISDCLFIWCGDVFEIPSNGTYPCVEPMDKFIEGCGGNYNIEFYGNALIVDTISYNLVYYKKKNKTWGTPYRCEDLVKVEGPTTTEQIKIYPNPAQDQFQVEVPGNFKSKQLQIINLLGGVVYEKKFNADKLSISSSGLCKGIYVVLIKCENKQIIRDKLIIE